MLPFLYGPGAQTEGVCIAWLSVRDAPLNQATKGPMLLGLALPSSAAVIHGPCLDDLRETTKRENR
ncbi:uncharacterized protein N7458_006917 [Penicillium daleae]|uniref:Uncharacterized protein n=1 Tax=Penicillium daleae TaxID=63821 RepID=A0AAD6C5A1_9EURO|nr:uncharacterized protein N7458_006917 [Penicillium daleae]KAJ5450468.1 hypothetical protein N7458_006917 [Penicillium daleae]